MHFTAPDGWLNDPHGVTWRNGRYTSVDEPNIDLGTVRLVRPAGDGWQRWHKGDIITPTKLGQPESKFDQLGRRRMLDLCP